MRIALLTREYPPETAWGGIGTHYAAFAAALRDAGCEVEVFVQGVHRQEVSWQDSVLVHRIVPRHWIVGPRSGGELGGGGLGTIGLFALALARAFRAAFCERHAEQPFDVVDSHEHLGVAALIYKPGATVLTVARYQTPYDSFVTRRMANWPRSRIVRYLEKRMIVNARARVATSHSIEHLVREDFPSAPPADAIIPNMSSVAVPDGSPLAVKEPLLIFVGRLMPGHKNPDMAAEAFVRLAGAHPGWRIEFAGNDIATGVGRTMWGRCEEILSAFPGRFHYHGVLAPEDLRHLYRRASILIMPSRIESYGLVALEAMSHGCVPVVADGTALPEVVGDGGVVFRRGDLDALVKALGDLLSDPERVRSLSELGMAETRRRYAPMAIVRENLSFFEREIERLPRRAHRP